MTSPFQSVQFHVTAANDDDLRGMGTRPVTMRGTARGRDGDPGARTFNSDETAARFFLDEVLSSRAPATLRGVRAPQQPELVPPLRLERIQESPATHTRLVRFEQLERSVPVFGSMAIVELDQNRELVSVNAELAPTPDVAPVATITPADALRSISKLTGADVEAADVDPPVLKFLWSDQDERGDGAWHLAYHFRKVPAAPEGFVSEALDHKSHGHGFGSSPRTRHPHLDYFVDAHDGEVVLYYSATPMLTVPALCRGTDEDGAACTFNTVRADPAGFRLHDPVRGIKTFTLGGADLDSTPIPPDPVEHASHDWSGSHADAISAHVNAARVFHFYSSVVYRDSVDDRGMELVSVVNCTVNDPQQPPPEWHNAVWWQDRMWYGQALDGQGRLRSYARYLDVIAHELTHGVTERTSNLIYRRQSGALNESFSDIFGIMIKNWGEIGQAHPVSVDGWDWELGSGLGRNGNLPLRDLSDPTRTGDPDHMDHYLNTWQDNGGVHTNSNIHNKAAYNVLTARDAAGKYVFKPAEAATLFYLTLTRLPSTATFSKALETLVTVADTYFPDAQERAAKTAAIRAAYGAAGIH